MSLFVKLSSFPVFISKIENFISLVNVDINGISYYSENYASNCSPFVYH